jgi:hypothetical protein
MTAIGGLALLGVGEYGNISYASWCGQKPFPAIYGGTVEINQDCKQFWIPGAALIGVGVTLGLIGAQKANH